MTDVRLSVALVTRNRPDSLARTLRSLRAQGAQPAEVIISDDSDDLAAREVVDLAAEFDCRYVRGPGRGLYANRNSAALACTGTHIRTMDDDHEFPAGHLEACLSAIAEDPDSVWIIGEAYPDQPLSSQLPVVCPGQLHPRGFSITPPDPQNTWALADGAAIFPAELFMRGVRYADEFTFGPLYLELGSRLYGLGYRMRQIQSTYVLHHLGSVRSITDALQIESSRIFAMLCHSFLYQRTVRNRSLTLAELFKQLLLHPSLTFRATRRASAAYRRRKRASANDPVAPSAGRTVASTSGLCTSH